MHTLGLQIHIAAHYCGYPAAVAVEYATTATSDTIHCNTVQLKYKLVHGVIFIHAKVAEDRTLTRTELCASACGPCTEERST